MNNLDLNDVVFDGVRFLESLSRYYGPDRGLELWEKIGETIPEIKGKVFFAMLTGESSGRVRIQAGACTEAVSAIKSIRAATGYGLKEAKDAWDLSKQEQVSLSTINHDARRQLVFDLRRLGMIVT